jgi:hypothetical protein
LDKIQIKYHKKNNGQINKQNKYPSMKVSKRYMSKNIPSLKNLDMGFAIRKATANIIDRL